MLAVFPILKTLNFINHGTIYHSGRFGRIYMLGSLLPAVDRGN